MKLAELATCRRMEEVLVQRDDRPDATPTASMQHHLQSCPTCRGRQQTWALVQQRALAANDVLDDLTRARVFGRVQASLAARPAREGGPGRRTRPMRTRFAWSLAFAAVVMLAFVLGTRLRTPDPGVAVTPVALEPYALHGPTEPRWVVPGKGLDHLELPPHASMRARLGPAADLTLLGPLELTVRDREKQRVELELGRGTLLADFDGSGGRSLRISTPDATVDIVGTRFMVDTSATRTRVAVAHGLVRVESKGRSRMVGAGLSWSTDQDALAPLDGGTVRMFARAALGQWEEELASESPPKDRKAETSEEDDKEGAKTGAKTGQGTIETGEGASRGTATERTVRRRRVHVRRPRTPLAVEFGGANQTEPRASQTDSSVVGSRLALVDAPQVPTRSPPPVPTAPLEEAAPAVVAPSPSAAPPAATVPVPTRPSASRATVSSLYKEAEQALKRGDAAGGKERLEALVRAFPRDTMADSARFELALQARQGGDQREALARLREILGHGTSGPFVEPARFLRCRVYLDEDRAAAETCLVRFVRDYPQSPHDEVAVRALVELSQAKGQCSKASQFAEMYLQRHPQGRFAEAAARVRSHCGE